MLKILRTAAVYFVLVFGTGFLLGTMRDALVVPVLGERLAEGNEALTMLFVILVAARWLTMEVAQGYLRWIAVGLLALCFVFAAEIGMAVWLRGQTFADYVATLDPVMAAVYALLLIMFGTMPYILAHWSPALEH